MSYQVLARKWRPQTFAELVGQDRVLKGLINALNLEKIHHAYLFTGTRGVGKTTVARLIAKSLNCEKGISATPCGTCNACVEITEGRFVDLIEIDAASRTKVDDTRALLDAVPFAPTSARFKIYLIDEVHMLSTHSFNALLKTLEEPPAHVKFLLATTDPQKLPVTILSRCLQFHLMSISEEDITKQLQHILQAEKITYEDTALTLISRAAKGSLRDALSILDQAIAFGDNSVNQTTTADMLGCVAEQEIFALLDAIVSNDANTLINTITRLSQQGVQFNDVLDNFSCLLHEISLIQQLPTLTTLSYDLEKVKHFNSRLSPQATQLLYQISIIGKRDLPLAPEPKLGFEMVMLRMLAFVPASAVVNTKTETILTATSELETPPRSTKVAPTNAPLPENTSQIQASPPLALPEQPIPQKEIVNPTETAPTPDWQQIVKEVPLTGMAKQFISHCSLSSMENDALALVVSAPYSNMLNKKLENKLKTALEQYFGTPISLTIHVSTSHDETPAMIEQRIQTEKKKNIDDILQKDKHVQYIQENFTATIAPQSIKTVD